MISILDPTAGGKIRTILRTLTLLVTAYGSVLLHLDPHTVAYILTGLTAADMAVSSLVYGTAIGNAPAQAPAQPVESVDEWDITAQDVYLNQKIAEAYPPTPVPPPAPLTPLAQVFNGGKLFS